MSRRSAVRFLLGSAAMSTLEASTIVLPVGGATLDVSIEEGFDLPREALLDWVKQAAGAVSGYFGRFPVPKARLRILATEGKGVSNATSTGEGGAHCRISVGRRASSAELRKDWTMTHEMVHFGFPSVPESHHWIEEGTATYIER